MLHKETCNDIAANITTEVLISLFHCSDVAL